MSNNIQSPNTVVWIINIHFYPNHKDVNQNPFFYSIAAFNEATPAGRWYKGAIPLRNCISKQKNTCWGYGQITGKLRKKLRVFTGCLRISMGFLRVRIFLRVVTAVKPGYTLSPLETTSNWLKRVLKVLFSPPSHWICPLMLLRCLRATKMGAMLEEFWGRCSPSSR